MIKTWISLSHNTELHPDEAGRTGVYAATFIERSQPQSKQCLGV